MGCRRPATGVKRCPSTKVKEESPGSLQEVPANPPKRVRVSGVKKTGDFWLAQSPRDSFWLFLGGRPGPLGDSLRLFFLSGAGDSQRDSRESIRANHSKLTPVFFMARQTDSPEALEFPIPANRATKLFFWGTFRTGCRWSAGSQDKDPCWTHLKGCGICSLKRAVTQPCPSISPNLLNNSGGKLQALAWPLCGNVSGIFVVYILEDFAGDFSGGFFWALFPTKMRRKNPATKSAKNRTPKIKIRKIRSAKNRP